MIGIITMNAESYNLPTRTIGNSEYYCYKVKSKETLFGISKQFGITQDELVKYNPSVVDGLKKDYVLLLPVNLLDSRKNNSNIEINNTSFTHTVKKGETLYGISKTYGISQEDIIAENPSANAGIKSGQILIIPQPKTKGINNNDDNKDVITYHTIQKGETLYRLSKMYNTSIENILKLNPSVTLNNFKTGVVVKIVANSQKSDTIEVESTIIKPYIAEKGDNLKKIAKKTSVDIDDLESANPNISKVKPGMTIQIPVDTTQSVEVTLSEGHEHELMSNNSFRIQEIYDSIHTIEQKNAINIALLLPFMLDNEEISKQTNLYTEFYKGFLIAINDLNYQLRNNVNINAYDIGSNILTLDSILDLPEMKEMDLIFAPENIDQLNSISKFCAENSIYFVNSFSLKTEDYSTNPNMIQINTPQDYLYSDVIEWISEKFLDYEMIFIHKTGTNYKELTKDIKNHLEQNHIVTKEIEYNKVLTYDILKNNLEPNKKYLFIPTSGTNSVMTNVVLASKKLKSQNPEIEFAVLGQPEWILYVDDWKANFHSVNTFLYSRFFADESNYDIKDYNEKYTEWYEEEVTQGAPCFAYLGYDLGRFFIEALNEYGNDMNSVDSQYKGLQSALNFERISSWSGLVNKSIFIINFSNNNNTYTTIK